MLTPKRVAKLIREYQEQLKAKPPRPGELTPEARLRGTSAAAAAVRASARAAYADVIPPAQALRAGGLPLRAIAEILNSEGYTTRQGRPWTKAYVMRLLRLADR
jgi:hypothetical protein